MNHRLHGRPWRFNAFAILILVCGHGPVTADPAWWNDPSTMINSSPSPPASEYWSPINVGQLKHVATQARNYLDLSLTVGGGAGSAVRSMTQFSNLDNFAPVNVGQLKNVLAPIYDRLSQVGYNWQTGAWGTPTQPYPWTGTIHPENWSPVNVGQLRKTFDFQLNSTFLNRDQDSDGLKDWWEKAFYGNTTTANSASDTDGDGVANAQEIAQGGNPLASDTDVDGLTDAQEIAQGKNIAVPDHPAVQLLVLIRTEQ